jgi:hypothetical protein
MAFYNQPYGYQPYGQAMPDQLAQLRQAQYQPMQPMAQSQTAQEPMIWVQGEAGAKAYMVAPGGSVVLWDAERYVFYIKTADQSGMPSMRVFEYTERGGSVPNVSQPNTNYVTRQEFDALVAKINAMTQTEETEVHHAE